MSTANPISTEVAPNRKERRRNAAKARGAEAKPVAAKSGSNVLTLLQGRALQTPRREPELPTAVEDEADFNESYAASEAYVLGGGHDAEQAEDAARRAAAEAVEVADATPVETREVDEFFEPSAPLSLTPAPVDADEEVPYTPPKSKRTKVQDTDEGSVATPDSVAEPVVVAAPPEMAVEATPAAVAVLQAAAEPEQPAKPSLKARLAAVRDKVVALVKWVDWVALAMLALIPLLIGSAAVYGAVATTVGIVAAILIGTVVRLLGSEVLAARIFHSRSKYLRVLFQVSLTASVGLLLILAHGGTWQALVGSLVFYLFATRRKSA